MAGPIYIVAFADIGELGPRNGPTQAYNWKWSYSAQALLLWVALLCALVLPKANRDRRAWLILVPLAIVNVTWLLLKNLTEMPSSAYELEMLIQSVTVGLAVLWLMAPRLGYYQALTKILASLAIMTIIGILAFLGNGLSFSQEGIYYLAGPIVTGAVLVLAMVASGLSCRVRHTPASFMLWLGLWMLLVSLVAFYGVFAFAAVVMRNGLPPSELANPRVLLAVAAVGAVLAVGLYVVNLPYMILGFASPFFRRRLQTCLGLPAVSRQPTSTAAVQAGSTSSQDPLV